MKKMRKIIVLLLCGIAAMHAQSRFEVFPLKKNLHYTYDYYLQEWVTQSLITWTNLVDSGSVEYIIGDALRQNDTTLVWNVREIQNLYFRGGHPYDTSYSVRDTIRLSLTEYTSGLHALQINGLVWKFSVGDPAKTVFRYDSVAHKEIINKWSSGQYPVYFTSGTDSLAIRDGMGLSYSFTHWDSHEGFMGDGGGGSRMAQLRSAPVTHVTDHSGVIAGFQLKQNFPNPFNPETNIEFELSSPSFTTLTIFDMLGRQTTVLLAKQLDKGSYTCVWNASRFPSGVYFYCLQSGSHRLTKKLLLQK